MATKYRTDSLYRNTGINKKHALDVLTIPVDELDKYQTQTITITNRHDQRPDLLAYDLYGNSKLWWVFAIFNQDILMDPIVDFKSGLQIIVPTKFT